MENAKIKLAGITTEEDAEKLLNVITDVWGVGEVVVNVHNSEAIFSYNEKAASFQDFEQAIIDGGYKVIKK